MPNYRSARFIMLAGADKVTSKQTRKTRKGAADLLELDDEKRALGMSAMFSAEQRKGLIERANGGSAKLYNPEGKLKKALREKKKRGEKASQDEVDALIRMLVEKANV